MCHSRNKAEALDHSISLTQDTELMPSLEALTETDETTNPLVPLMIQDIFSFALQEKRPGQRNDGSIGSKGNLSLREPLSMGIILLHFLMMK